MSVKAEVQRLYAEAEKLDAAIREMQLRPGYYLFDWALALLAWQGVASARTIGRLVQSGEVEGAIPTFRFLFEIGVDLAYLATRPEDDKETVAAFSVAWEIWQLERQYQQVSKPAPDHLKPDQPPSERLKDFCEDLEAIGVATRFLRDAFDKIKGKRRNNGILTNHWSGMTRTQVFEKIQQANRREVPRDFEVWARQLWTLTSTGAHSSPVWKRADRKVKPGETPVLPDYESQAPQLERMARNAADWLCYFPLWIMLARE